jgi:hypothetical protein
MRPNFVGEVILECAGVRFLVWNTELGKILQNKVAFHFQFTR